MIIGPRPNAQTDTTGWQNSIIKFNDDLQQFAAIVQDPLTDLYADLPHAPGYSIMREILVLTSHNAYHTGELAILRQVMDLWPSDH